MKIYRYKLHTNAKRGELSKLVYRFGIVRNYAVKMMRLHYRLYGKTLNAYSLSNHIARKKRSPNCATAKMVVGLPSQAVQECIARVYKGYKNFFSYCKRKKGGTAKGRVRPPNVRKPCRNKSFTLLQCGYKFSSTEKNKVRIGDRTYGFFKSQEINGRIKRITIKRDSCGDLWIAVLTDWEESREMPKTGRSAGYDFGLKTFLTRHDGKRIDSPEFLKRDFARYRDLCRKLSRKQRGSNNSRKARLALARFLRRIENRREDWQWKTAREILKEFDIVCLETLNLEGMKRRWGRKVSDYGFASFVNKLEYLAKTSGKEVRHVTWDFPSSQTCCVCGHRDKSVKDLRVREWTCSECGTRHDRDVNAAKNILTAGASADWRGSVRPSPERGVA